MPRTVSPQRKRRERARVLGVTGVRRDFEWLCNRGDGRHAIVSEGDSWFSYPREWLVAGPNSNAIDHIYDFLGGGGARSANLLRLESSGDKAVAMTEGRQMRDLVAVLESCEPPLLLFSAGGNDIVGKDDLPPLLHRYQPGYEATDCIDHEAFEERRTGIREAYERVVSACTDLSPETTVVTHTNDLPQPRDAGAEFLWGLEFAEPWMHPYLEKKEIRDPDLQRAVIAYLLTRFRDDILALAARNANLRVADTQGTLRPGSDEDWLNEIHPTSSGFRQIARKIYAEMRAVLPDLPAVGPQA